MASKDRRNGRTATIVIRRVDAPSAGHHGGAWKVAYADFITALMAFFLLMWLLNATTEEQRKGLADYFSPTNEISRNHAGSGLPLGGKTAFEEGSLVTDRGAVRVITGPVPVVDQDEDTDVDTIAKPRVYRQDPDTPVAQPADDKAQAARKQAADQEAANQQAADHQAADQQAGADARERRQFEAAADQIRQSVQADPALATLGRQLAIDITPEGLRIQILDEDQQPMFATGSAAPNDRARLLLQKVGPVLARLTEDVSIAGHTDAAPFPGPERTNWELSAERANATRRLLVEAGLPIGRVREVTGNADRDPLVAADPMAAVNRRIAVTVLRKAPAAPAQPAPVQPALAPAPGPVL